MAIKRSGNVLQTELSARFQISWMGNVLKVCWEVSEDGRYAKTAQACEPIVHIRGVIDVIQTCYRV
eukprot:2622813-Amphidinium_carterae.2